MFIYIISLFLVAILSLLAERHDYRDVYVPFGNEDCSGNSGAYVLNPHRYNNDSYRSRGTERSRKIFLPYQHSRYCRLFYIMAVSVLIIIAGLRYHTGTDYWQYERNAYGYSQDVWNSIITYNEPGIRILAKIGYLFNNDNPAPVMFFLASALTIGLFCRTIYKYSDELCFPLMLFVLLGCWTDSFNGVRQYLASAVFFCSIPYLQSRKLIKYLLVIFIASLFHKSILFLIPIYFLTNRRIDWKNLLLIIFSTGVILIAFNTFTAYVASFMEVSAESHYFTLNVNILRVLAGCAPGILFWIFYHNTEIDFERTTYINLMMIHAAFWAISSQSAYLARVCMYTTPFLTVGMTRTSQLMSNSTRKIVRFVMIVLYFVFWIYEINKSSNLRAYHWILSS